MKHEAVLVAAWVSLLLMAFFCLVPNAKAEPGTWTVDDDGSADFSSIQEAIDSPQVVDGDTIRVNDGIYYENVVVGKKLLLVGEDRSTTVIDGMEIGTVVTIAAHNVMIGGFTIRGSRKPSVEYTPSTDTGVLVFAEYAQKVENATIFNNDIRNNYVGIFIWYSLNNTIIDNKIESNFRGIGIDEAIHNSILRNTLSSNVGGIWLGSGGNNISGNNISSNLEYGLQLDGSFQNMVDRNVIANNSRGIELRLSSNNVVSGNNITRNEDGIKLIYESSGNRFYHNNAVNNTQQVNIGTSGYSNFWDYDYPAGGNYWSDYKGVDDFRGPSQNELGSDGIGDTPYSIDAGNQDRYPLINAWSSPISASAVSGKVSEADGVTPIVGATVEALQQGDLVVSSTTTDASGNYSLPLMKGAYKVRASAVGYITATKPVVNITTGTTTACFNLTEGETTLAFDEFTGTSLNASKWNSHLTGLGAIGISNATSELTGFSCVGLSSGYGGEGSAAITSKATATLDSTIIFEGRVSAYWEGHWYPGVYSDYQPRGLRIGTDPDNAIEFISYARDTVEARTVSSGTETASQYLLPLGKMVGDYDLTYRIEATSESVKFYVNNTLIANHVTNIPTGQFNIYVGTSYDGYGNVPVGADYLFMVGLPPPAPQPKVGVKTGDWIKLDYAIAGAASGAPSPRWIKIEFLNVEGTTADVRVTMHMSDGTEPSQTMTIDVAVGSGAFQGLSGFVIPANSTAGHSVHISGYGNVTIAGETTRNYARASRTVVYASFSQLGSQITYYWDKQTGILVEASTTSGSITASGKATETNMWQADPASPIDPRMLYPLLAIVIVTVTAIFIVRRKKQPK